MDFPLDELKRLFDRKAATDALRGLGRYAKGVGESAIDIGGGMAGQAIGGLNALVAPTEREASRRVEAGAQTGQDLSRLVRSGYGGLSSILRGEGLQRAAQEVKGTKESGPEAQELQAGAERVFKPAQEGAQWLGEKAADTSGLPMLGAMVATAGEAATQLDLPGLKAPKSPVKAAKRAAITDILRGERAPVVPREEWGPRFYSPLDTLLADPKTQFKPVPPEGLANWLAKNGINAEEILDRKLSDFIERKQKSTETSRISEEFFTKQLNDRYQEARAAGDEAEMARLQERIAEHKATIKENRANALVTLEDLRTHAANNPMSDFEVNLVDDSRHKKQLQKEWEGLQEGDTTPRDPSTFTPGEQARKSQDPAYETDSRQHGVVDQRLVVEGNTVTDPVTGHRKEFPDSRLNEREMRDATIREIMSWDRDPVDRYSAPMLPFDDADQGIDMSQGSWRDRAWDRHDRLEAEVNDAANRNVIDPYDPGTGDIRTEAMIDELRRNLPEEQVQAEQRARNRYEQFTRGGGTIPTRQRYGDSSIFPDELARPRSNAPPLPNKFTGNSLGYNYTTAGHKKSTYYPALKDFLGEPEMGTSMQNVTISHPDMGNWVPTNESLHGEVMGHPAGDKMYAYTRNEVRRVTDPETGELTPALHVDESQSDPYNKGRIKGFKGEVQTEAIKNAPDKYRKELDEVRARKREISDEMDRITSSTPDPYQTPEYKALEKEFTDLETRVSVLRDNASGAQNRVDYGGTVPYIPGLKNYPNVLARLNLRLAAENGLDLVSMATGEENAARWPGASHAPGLVNLYNKGFIPTMAGEMRRLESEAGGKAGAKDLAHTTTPGREATGSLDRNWSSPAEGATARGPERMDTAAKVAALRGATTPTPVKTRAGKVSKQAQALALRRGMSPYLIPLGLGLEGLLGDDEQ